MLAVLLSALYFTFVTAGSRITFGRSRVEEGGFTTEKQPVRMESERQCSES